MNDRERLAAALAESRPWHEPWAELPETLRKQFRITADALMPVVDAIAAERAAAELRAAADFAGDFERNGMCPFVDDRWLHDRADAILAATADQKGPRRGLSAPQSDETPQSGYPTTGLSVTAVTSQEKRGTRERDR